MRKSLVDTALVMRKSLVDTARLSHAASPISLT